MAPNDKQFALSPSFLFLAYEHQVSTFFFDMILIRYNTHFSLIIQWDKEKLEYSKPMTKAKAFIKKGTLITL